MNPMLTPTQRDAQQGFRAFVEAEVAPFADRMHRDEQTPRDRVEALIERGYLGATLPETHGGAAMDFVTFALLTEEVGRACSSLRSLLTVHTMSAHALLRWGTPDLKGAWLPRLARGEALAAFALSEPSVGSNAAGVETTADAVDDGFVLNGTKTWITYGEVADVYLVFARCGDAPSAFLVERDRPGVSVEPIRGLIGVRASMTATVRFDACCVPASHRVGRPGFGFGPLVTTALTHGRLSVGMGCVGLTQACLDASLAYTAKRTQFGQPLKDFQLIRRLVTEMAVQVEAARALGLRAAALMDAGDPNAPTAASQAKYFAARAASRAANDAVQIHGGNGCSADYPVQRYLGDAKVMEIIEGSNQIHQITLAEDAYRSHAVRTAQPATAAPVS